MKRCTKCGEEKDLSGFHKDKTKKDGLTSNCKTCRIEKEKRYYKRNKEQILEYKKEWKKGYYANNKEQILEKGKKYQRERRQNNSLYRMICNYRTRVSNTYKNKFKSTIELLGCDGEELAKHLEEQFQEGMTHDNYGEWHIDHIRPIASFDLSNPKEAEECFHYTNLQPLWAEDNLKKSDKWM